MTKVVALPGDETGPEIMECAVEALDKLAPDVEVEEREFGGASIDTSGTPMTDETLGACRKASAVLLAAVGGPKWDTTDPDAPRPEQGLLALRKKMGEDGLFANLRPVKPQTALIESSPLRPELLQGTDLLTVRELTGGIYFGKHSRSEDGRSAKDVCEYSYEEIERIARVAFAAAGRRRNKVTSIDKANVLETSKLWREVVTEIAEDYPGVELEHILVDNMAMQLVARPADFDVLLAENLFGDIISDESAMLSGSLGMLPSASLGAKGDPGLFEPVHGSAPDKTGTGEVNPMAMYLTTAMMLRHGLDRPEEADVLEHAVDKTVEAGILTPDLKGDATTKKVADSVLSLI